MKTFDWRTGQLISKAEQDDFQLAIENFVKNLTVNYFESGFTVIPEVVENSPADFTVDINLPSGQDIIARDTSGEMIKITSSQNADLTSLGVTLPSGGNEKYVSIMVGYIKNESDPRLDPVTSNPYNYVLDDGFEITVIQGSEATAGSAVRPSDPMDGRLLMANILLNSGSSVVTDSMIDQVGVRRSLSTSTPPLTISKNLFYLDGINQLTNAEVFNYEAISDFTLIGFSLSVSDPRTAGSLDCVMKKNGTIIDGSTATIDASNPSSNNVSGLNVIFQNGDILTVEATTTAFTPLSNMCEFYVSAR